MDFLPTTRIGQSGMEFVSSEDGTKLGVRVAGGKGHRTPVIMLHGLQSHSGWFVQSQTFLANLGFPVFAMDRRGSGFSEGARGDCPDFREMIADVHAVVKLACERHDVEKVHIFGHCFGTIPAALFATAHSGLVASLVKASSGVKTAEGIAAVEIIEAAKREGVDMIIMATHGHTGVKHLFLGSTTEKVVRTSPCPVLTVRSKAPA
jgi:pimeloyl-ACP methyl ester carboxylesterase